MLIRLRVPWGCDEASWPSDPRCWRSYQAPRSLSTGTSSSDSRGSAFSVDTNIIVTWHTFTTCEGNELERNWNCVFFTGNGRQALYTDPLCKFHHRDRRGLETGYHQLVSYTAGTYKILIWGIKSRQLTAYSHLCHRTELGGWEKWPKKEIVCMKVWGLLTTIVQLECDESKGKTKK